MSWDSVGNFIKGWPLIGGLHECTAPDHKQASKEMALNMVLAILPIWILPIILIAAKSGNFNNYFDVLITETSNGELYLYCTSILAPIFYMVLDDTTAAKPFHTKPSHMCFVGIIMAISTGLFTVTRLVEQPNEVFIANISKYMFLFCVIISYLAMVYNNNRRSPAEIMHDQQENFVNKFGNHIREGGNG